MKQWMKANQTALLLSGSILVSATGLGVLREYGNSQQLMVAEAKLSAAQSSLALNEAENAARKADGASALRECPPVQAGAKKSDRKATRAVSAARAEAMEAGAEAAAAGAEAAAEGAAAAADME